MSEIYREGFPTAHPNIPLAYSQDYILSLRNIILPHWPAFVYDVSGQAVAFMLLIDDVISDLYVAPSWQRKGIGRQLLRHAQQLRSLLSLEVFLQNHGAISLYEQLGFVKVDSFEESGQTKIRMKWQGGL